jgi:large subunit ribosomal protein L21
VELLDVAEGSTVEMDRVLLIAEGDKVTVGTPIVEGAKVLATSKGNDREEKIIVFKYKNKTRYAKKTGHKQPYTRLMIDKIIEPGTEEVEVKKVRRRKSEVKESGT